MVAGMPVQILLSIAGTLCLFTMFLGVGSFLLSRFDNTFNRSFLFTLIKTGLGFGVTGNLIMALCFFHSAYAPVVRWTLAVLFFAALPFAWRELQVLAGHAARVATLLRETHPTPVIILVALLAGYGLRGLLPPSDFDGLMYHLASIKLFLAHGGFFHVYFNPQADFPMLTEMVYMIGLAFGNDILCKTVSFCLGLMVCASCALLCRRHCSKPSLAIPSMLVFLTLTNTIANMSTCYVDLPLALWMVLAVLCMELFCECGFMRYAVFSGLFAGMAMETKIFGVIILPVLFVQLLMRGRTNMKGLARDCLAFVLPAVLLGLPWYLKSFVHTGTILSIGHGVIQDQGLGNPMGVAVDPGPLFWLINIAGRIAFAPWTFSLFLHQHQGDTFGPLFIALLPFMLFIKVPRAVRLLLIYAGIYLAAILAMEIWFIPGGSSIRYSVFVLIILPPVLVWTVSQLSHRPALMRMLTLMIACMVALGAILFAKRYAKDWKALMLMKSRDAYLTSVLPEYPVIKKINSIRDGSKVMPVYNFSNYLIDIPYIAAYRRYSGIEEVKNDFKAKKIRYVFGNNVLDTAENSNPFPEIQKKELVYCANGFYLFKVPW